MLRLRGVVSADEIVTNVIVLIKGNTPLMYGCAGGHEEVVRVLLDSGANVEDHNENGHTPLMEAASAGHVQVAKILLEHGAGINTHSNEFKESALTLACYKGHLEMVRFLLEAGADQVTIVFLSFSDIDKRFVFSFYCCTGPLNFPSRFCEEISNIYLFHFKYK